MATVEDRTLIHAQKYRELAQALIRDNEVTLRLERSKAEREQLDQSIQTKMEQLEVLKKITKKRHDEMCQWRQLSLRSAAATLSGKKRTLATKGEAKYQQALDNEQKCKLELDRLLSDRSVTSGTVSRWQKEMDDMDRTRSDMTCLLDEILQDTQSDYPKVVQMKDELQNYTDQTRMATRDMGRFKDTVHNLSEARQAIPITMQLISHAVNLSSESSKRTQLDPQHRSYIESAKTQIHEIQRRLDIVRQVLPEIPHPGSLDIVSSSLIMTTCVENYVDVTWKAKAQHTYALLATLQQNIDLALGWVQQYIQYTHGALQQLSRVTDSTQKALDKERRRIVDTILSGQPMRNNFSPDSSPTRDPSSLHEKPLDTTTPSNKFWPHLSTKGVASHPSLPSPSSLKGASSPSSPSQAGSDMALDPFSHPEDPPAFRLSPSFSQPTVSHRHNYLATPIYEENDPFRDP